MTTEDSIRLAKIADMRRQLERMGFKTPIPQGDLQRAKYFKSLRKSLDLTAITFWGLFNVPPSTGQKYEQLRSDLVRHCPDDVIQALSDGLGLVITPSPTEAEDLEQVPQLSQEQRRILLFVAQHGLTLQDLKNYVEIQKLFSK